jgi:hypothetical protein
MKEVRDNTARHIGRAGAGSESGVAARCLRAARETGRQSVISLPGIGGGNAANGLPGRSPFRAESTPRLKHHRDVFHGQNSANELLDRHVQT